MKAKMWCLINKMTGTIKPIDVSINDNVKENVMGFVTKKMLLYNTSFLDKKDNEIRKIEFEY